jgi:hypothetical protein
MITSLAKWLARRVARKAAHEILTGRVRERNRPEGARLLRRDVDAILEQAWRNVDEMVPEARLDQLPTRGNRLNVFFAVFSLALYRALVDAEIERDYAIELFADVGWKVYERFIVLPRWIARIMTRDRQRRLELILRALMVFPFSRPGRPGYEARVWSEPDALCTHWTHCPPFEFVRRWTEDHGDQGELELFRRSWCAYDWAFNQAMVNGDGGQRGHYERPHTLSSGDEVCDMRWSATDSPSVSLADEREPARAADRLANG